MPRPVQDKGVWTTTTRILHLGGLLSTGNGVVGAVWVMTSMNFDGWLASSTPRQLNSVPNGGDHQNGTTGFTPLHFTLHTLHTTFYVIYFWVPLCALHSGSLVSLVCFVCLGGIHYQWPTVFTHVEKETHHFSQGRTSPPREQDIHGAPNFKESEREAL